MKQSNMYYLISFVVICFSSLVVAYKPVVLLHGILTGSESMELIKSRIEEVSSEKPDNVEMVRRKSTKKNFFRNIPVLLFITLIHLGDGQV